MRNMGEMSFWKYGWVCLLAGALAFSLGACRTQEGPVIQEKKDNREQTGAFEIKGLKVRTFKGLDITTLVEATSATMDLATNQALLDQVLATQFTSGTLSRTFQSGSGIYFTQTPAKNQVVPEYLPGFRPHKGDFYLLGGVDINDRGQTIKAPSLFYLNVPTSATQTGKTDDTTVTIVSGNGNVQLGIPGKSGRTVIEAKSFKTDKYHRKSNFSGPIKFSIENSTTNTQNVTTVAEPSSVTTEKVAPPVVEKKAESAVPSKSAPKAEAKTDSAAVKKPEPNRVRKSATKAGSAGNKKSTSKAKSESGK